MNQPHPFERFRGKRGLVMGLGLFGGGLDSARFLASLCSSVVVTDLRNADALGESIKALKELPVEMRLGEHRESDFRESEVVIHSPAVRPDHPLLRAARDNGAEVTMEMSLFIEACPARSIGITGSNGKTTATLLCYEMLCEVMQRAQPELAGRWAQADAAQPQRAMLATPGMAPIAESTGKVWLGGNLGQPLLSRVTEMNADDVAVLELSSFQLQDWHRIKRSADIALITNITPNHLDWHTGMDEYIHAKCAVFEYQPQGRRCVILNMDDERCRNLLEMHPRLQSERDDLWKGPMFAPLAEQSQPAPQVKGGPKLLSLAMAMGEDETENPEDAIIGYSVDPDTERGNRVIPAITRYIFAGGTFESAEGRRVAADPDTLTEWRRGFAFVGALQREQLHLPGLFNWSNAAGAYAAASAALSDIRMAPAISGALARFRGAEHRLEFCGEVGGARCYNDSIATTPEATIAALTAFESGVHLLLGGSDKGLSYAELAQAIADHPDIRGIYLQGNNADSLASALSHAGLTDDRLLRFSGFDQACQAAFERLRPGDTLLMSPASASFYEYAPGSKFTNFEHRGLHFKELVRRGTGRRR